VLVLLASACVPVLAQAETCDSSTIQYGECGAIPHSGLKKPQHPKSRGGEQSRSTPDKPAPGAGEAEAPDSEGEPEGKHAGPSGGSGGSGGNKPGGGGRATIGLADEQAVGGGGAPKVHDLAQSDGGSSPVVPILVAVAVLAALSFGAVIYRQRRHISVG